jgi:DNA repair exonuclease SbcCD nuclease subunit
MQAMKFIHVTDTHLGKTESQIREREQDFYKSFEQVIDRAIKEKVDFVIHSGDLFDTARPPTRTLIFAIKQLSRLKEAEIPCFIAAGSHDIGVDDTMISVFEELGLLKNISSNRYYSVDGNNIIIDGELFNGTFICGIAGRRANIEKTYEKLKPARKGDYNIFIFHHIISDISEKFSDIPTSMLPHGFDYYAGGHWHGFFQTKYREGIVVYPGSTDYNDLNEMEKDPAKYFCLVTVKDGKTNVHKIEIETRKIVSLTVNCNDMDAAKVSEAVVKKIPPEGEGKILIIKMNGKLGKGVKSEIDRIKISDSSKSKGYLYSKIYIGELENPEAPFVSAKRLTPSEIETEYLEKQKYRKEEIKVAKQLITLLGKKLKPSETEARIKAATEVVRGFLLENN